MTDLRYPIGRFEPVTGLTAGERAVLIERLAGAPQRLREAVAGLTPEQIDTPYREGGWTVRQVVHHVADSHLNSYVRFRWALTEEEPLIKAYDEKAWALLPDAKSADLELSLALLDALHARWVTLLKGMTEQEFNRTLRHPEVGVLRLETMLGLYDWHSRHHTAHITSLRESRGW